jgi:hypothetical protein
MGGGLSHARPATRRGPLIVASGFSRTSWRPALAGPCDGARLLPAHYPHEFDGPAGESALRCRMPDSLQQAPGARVVSGEVDTLDENGAAGREGP